MDENAESSVIAVGRITKYGVVLEYLPYAYCTRKYMGTTAAEIPDSPGLRGLTEKGIRESSHVTEAFINHHPPRART